MRKPAFFFKTTLATAVASCLLMGSAARAGELGFGFKPGLVAGQDYVAGELIVGYREGSETQSIVSVAQAAG